ncbi:MAG: hypothetical protein SOI13_04245 [Bifidobacterium mongoliense]|jgi:hypothetical protein|uniref:hypothetical protein n=1 Tax=Bifidobacterium mongoliense TaxID=518643 RepID=UPI002F35CCEC
MSWYESGGFTITRDKSKDSAGAGIRFRLSIYLGDGQTRIVELTKSDVQCIKREATRALKEKREES